MQTYSHFLWTLALYRWMSPSVNNNNGTTTTSCCCSWMPRPVSLSAVLFGSILPDLPLITLTIVCILVDAIQGSDWTDELFSNWYFESPLVKAAHNWFHSPITLSAMLALLGLCRSSSRGTTATAAHHESTTSTDDDTSRCCCRSSSWWIWVLMASSFHTLCDIPVHHDDGPLILFPFNWEYRFHSPLSYWDPNYHGHVVAIMEHSVDACIVVWEARRRFCITRRRPEAPVASYEPVNNDSTTNDDEVISVTEPSIANVELRTLEEDGTWRNVTAPCE